MITTIVVDDEKPAVDEIVYMLKFYDNIDVVGAFTDPFKALEMVYQKAIDVVFLDISMPEMDGFMVAQMIMKLPEPPFIVFATAYDEYALQAFEIHAIDYILKPLDEERLNRTIKYIQRSLEQKQRNDRPIHQLLYNTQKGKGYDKLPVWKNDRIYLINKKDILFCTTNGHETTLVTTKEQFITQDTLTELEKQLDSDAFFRCHRSYIIRLDAICEIIPWFNNTYAVKFPGCDEQVPISRRNSKVFKSLMYVK